MPNGKSDIKLLHGQAKIEAWDLCVDSKDRRKSDTPHRRALVHDLRDGLTVNYAEDYPNGVTILKLGLVTGELIWFKCKGMVVEGHVRINGPTFLGQVENAQENWRWCKKCEGLFFDGRPTKGVCPAGGEHETGEGSANYRLLR